MTAQNEPQDDDDDYLDVIEELERRAKQEQDERDRAARAKSEPHWEDYPEPTEESEREESERDLEAYERRAALAAKPPFAVEELVPRPPPPLVPAAAPAAAPQVTLPATLGALAESAFARIERRRAEIERPLPLPWPDVEAQFGGGLWPGLHVLVGGTGTGKTQWALQVALAAAESGSPALYIGLELDELDIVARVAGLQAGIPWSGLMRGEIDPDGARAAITGAWLDRFYAEFGQSHGWGYERLEPLVRLIRAKHPEPNGPGSAPLLVVLDFLQVVGTENPRARLELRERIAQASYAGRMVARDLGAVVLLVSSAARDKYGLLAGAVQDANLQADGGIGLVDVLIGLGKESGEIEYSADSLTVLVKGPRPASGPRPICVATSKNRAAPPGWSVLSWTGTRYDTPADAALRGPDAMREDFLQGVREQAEAAKSKGNGAPRKGARERGERPDPLASLLED